MAWGVLSLHMGGQERNRGRGGGREGEKVQGPGKENAGNVKTSTEGGGEAIMQKGERGK